MTTDVVAALIADAYRVGIVIHAVGTYLPFRTSRLYCSVTTDDVVVADAELKPSVPVPRVYLCRRTRVVGLTADVQTSLIANTDRVFVVVLACYMAVGAYHPFRTAWLYCPVTTDDVVVADSELEASLAMPRVYLGCR